MQLRRIPYVLALYMVMSHKYIKMLENMEKIKHD